jgi:hypothetical protein
MTLSSRELSLLSNTDVLGYIQAQNAEINAQAKAEGWEFWTLMSEEIASDYANAYELELEFARGSYADAHKDWCGCKAYAPRRLTLEQVEAEVSKMADWAEEAYKAELAWAAQQAKLERDDIMLGLAPVCAEVQLEQWEIYEAKAEAEGY